jgi:hypothetical protein
VDSLERFHQSRAIIEDFSSQTLAAIPTDFGRLYYVSSLKDTQRDRYRHDGLASLYPDTAVQAALAHCHEELFSKILETPLKDQRLDLGRCLGSAGEKYWEIIESWRENHSFQEMCPQGVPEYLHELFCSNINVLLAIFSSTKPN